MEIIIGIAVVVYVLIMIGMFVATMANTGGSLLGRVIQATLVSIIFPFVLVFTFVHSFFKR